MDASYHDLLGQADRLSIAKAAFISGQAVPSASGETFSCISPRSGHEIVRVAACGAEDVDQAVLAARQAYEAGVWSLRSPEERKQVLLQLADLLEKHAMELALLGTLDMGMPITTSFYDDVADAISKIRWIAECIDKLYDQVAPTANNVLAFMTREPCGVVGCVTPWNFPLYIACAKVIPALAMGNSVVLKPAEQSSLSAIRLAALAFEAGIPAGVFNVVTGFGETAGQAIGMHPDIDVVAFTGSTEIGRRFLRYSAESNMKRVLLECGGKSPNIIFADCQNLDKAVRASAKVFYNQGEVCSARTRLLVEKSILPTVMEKLKYYSDSYQPGDPLDPDVKMGAMVDQEQLKRVLGYIELAQKEGVQIEKGGHQVKKESGGYFIEPTIFSGVDNAMRIAQEEIFGPVLCVQAFTTQQEAIQIANASIYGLAASVWTQNINRAHQCARDLRVGVVSVNANTIGNETTPFGGYKQSGLGREGSMHDFDNFTEMKTTWIALTEGN